MSDNKVFKRIAKIILDSAQWEYYKAALKESIKTALNTEGGK